VVLGQEDDVAYRSFRNLPDVQLVPTGELNAYDVLCNDWVVFTEATLPSGGPGIVEASERVAPPSAPLPSQAAPESPAAQSLAAQSTPPQPRPAHEPRPAQESRPAQGATPPDIAERDEPEDQG